jgi:coenzyme F420-reducing hydrogenase gamma subunit
MSKPKFAMYWAASCGGCEIAVLNIHEKILDVDANFDVVFWPVAMDAKYKDVEAMEDGSITLCLFNGGMRNDENEHVAKLLRKKSQIMVAFGSCACEGFYHPQHRQSPKSAPANIVRGARRHPDHPHHESAVEDPRSSGGCGLLHARLSARIASDCGGGGIGDCRSAW